MTRTFDYRKLTDPNFYAEGRLPAHSDHIICRNEQEAWDENSSLRLSLNGLWNFRFSKNLEDLPKGFEKPEYNCHEWDDIRVPAHIQMEGYGIPQYVNTQYPWDGREEVVPPCIPVLDHPIGNYVKYFKLPEGFISHGVYIRFDGVESAFAIWCNGRYIGYSSDTFDAKEFDLTPFINSDGENKLALQVFKYSAASWMEDQDMFRFSGIFRDVTLFTRTSSVSDVKARKKVSGTDVYDIRIETVLADDLESADLKVRLRGCGIGDISMSLIREKWDLASSKMIPEGDVVTECETSWDSDYDGADYDALDGVGFEDSRRNISNKQSNVTIRVDKPLLWSAEKPNLYSLMVVLYDENGMECGVIRQEVGFRRFEMGSDHIMYLNGRRIVFNGTDRHEFSARTGRALARADMETDIRNMKRANINALRMSHYPNNSYMYKLCDRYGIYVIDETNLETHGTWEAADREFWDKSNIVPGDNENWLSMLLDRGHSMLERDKNHPSILIWSCGNEAHGGKVIYELSRYFHEEDPTRLVHYEGVCHDRRYNDTSDMESRMYPPVSEIKSWLQEHRDKPFICCEYTHAMGNSCGAMFKYTELTREDDLYQGGFIWDYIDQSIMRKDRYGKEYQAYGGDCGDRPSDYDFCGNGIAFGGDERKPSPKMQSVKYNYQPFLINVDEDSDTVTVRNLSLFTDTSEYVMRVSVSYYGENEYQEDYSVSVAPGDEETFELGLEEKIGLGEICNKNGEYTIDVSFLLMQDTSYAKAGYEVAFGQDVFSVETDIENNNPSIIVPDGIFSDDPGITLCSDKPYKVVHGPNGTGIRGENFDILFSHISGGITSYRYGGREMLASKVVPNFWRAPTQNDMGNGEPIHYGQWKLASLYAAPREEVYTPYGHFLPGTPVEVEEKENRVTVRYNYKLPTTPAAECFITYEVYGDGTVAATLEYDPVAELKDMPEFGMMFKMDADYHNLKWYGYGPEETYADKMAGSRLSVFGGKAETELTPYLMPQEGGNHAGVRIAAITDDRGRGLMVAAADPEGMSFSAMPWTPHEIENAQHHFELPPVHYTVVRTSLAQLGVSGDDTWGSLTHPEFRIPVDGKMHFTMMLRGL